MKAAMGKRHCRHTHMRGQTEASASSMTETDADSDGGLKVKRRRAWKAATDEGKGQEHG